MWRGGRGRQGDGEGAALVVSGGNGRYRPQMRLNHRLGNRQTKATAARVA